MCVCTCVCVCVCARVRVCVARYERPYNNELVETNLGMVIEEFKAKVLMGSGWLATHIALA